LVEFRSVVELSAAPGLRPFAKHFCSSR
jgi:hypothetical protein